MSRTEEKQGRFEKALSRLGNHLVDHNLAIPVQWSRFRLNLKLRRMHMALGVLDELEHIER